MNILKDFGVNPVLLIAQIVNFLIILFVLKRFMYKPVLKILKKREDEIKKGLEDADMAQKKLEGAIEKEKKILQNAQDRVEKIISEAKLEAQEIKDSAQNGARKETERILEQARQTIDQETKTAEERLIKRIGVVAIALLERSLMGIFGEKEQKLILKKAQSELMKHG